LIIPNIKSLLLDLGLEFNILSFAMPRRWIDNIRIGLLEIGLGVEDWIGLAQVRYRCRAVVNAVMNLRVIKNPGKLPSGCTTCGLSSGTQFHRVS
jgi:hypothetical protein